MAFCSCLLSLRIMFPRFIHVILGEKLSHFLTSDQVQMVQGAGDANNMAVYILMDVGHPILV